MEFRREARKKRKERQKRRTKERKEKKERKKGLLYRFLNLPRPPRPVLGICHTVVNFILKKLPVDSS